MNNICIVYATMTNHSKKLAQAIGQALHVNVENVKKNPILNDVDLLFIVGGIYSDESLPDLVAFVNQINGQQVKRAVLVTSCASKKKGQDSIRAILNDKGIAVVDEVICQGSFLVMGLGHPNQRDIEQVVRFAREVVKKSL